MSAYNSAAPGATKGSKFVIVALNVGSSPLDETFAVQDIASGTATVTPFVTSRTQNCEQQNGIVVSNGTFTATLGDSSITTFVGNVVTGVDDIPKLPKTFELHQNYPNPFNPTTRIDYALPEAVNVSLKVYNILGIEVANLYSGFRQPGNYSVVFDGSTFASGIYFYRLSAGSFVTTRKLILLK